MPLTIFEKNKLTTLEPKTTFNLAHESNTFNNIFGVTPLEKSDETSLQRLLVEGYQPGIFEEHQVGDDVKKIVTLTEEIKAIGKQCVVLLGERVSKARDILKPYKDGTFTRWLEAAFGSRKSGYNALGYYELHKALPADDLREKLAKLQKRLAYTLASREGDINIKAEIIKECHNKSPDEAISIMKEKLPASNSRPSNTEARSPVLTYYWGKNDLMVTAAHRYCLGRKSYIVSDCVEWLISIWPKLQAETKRVILKETQEAIDKNKSGMTQDIEQWLRIIQIGA